MGVQTAVVVVEEVEEAGVEWRGWKTHKGASPSFTAREDAPVRQRPCQLDPEPPSLARAPLFVELPEADAAHIEECIEAVFRWRFSFKLVPVDP